MKKPSILLLFFSIALAGIFIYSFKNMGLKDNYKDKIQKERADKDKEFKSGDDSPLKNSQKSQFSGLYYYPVNKDYVVEADFEPYPIKETIRLAYSDGTEKEYEKFGYVYFKLSGVDQKLVLLKPTFFEDKEYLFLPFYDETSANETYGGGRYIDLDLHVRNKIVIDFNKAYNPYCAYNGDYRCPIPPRENKITVPVLAGEKKFELSH